MAYLEVLNGPEVGQQLPIVHDTIFIGRDPNNHLILSDRTVSRKHAVINQVDGGFVVSDLQSLKGLLVNGVKKTEADLEDGDEVTFGAVRIRFHEGDEVPQEAPKRRNKSWLLIVFIVLIVAGGGYYFLQRHATPSEQVASDEASLKQHYEEGINLFNEANFAEAKREWEAVLKGDPDQKTIYGQKAFKLLQNLP